MKLPLRNRLATLATCLALAACSSTTEPSNASVAASLSLSADSISTYPGWSQELPTVTVYNAHHDVIQSPVTWTTGDSAVAQIHDGAILAHGIGLTSLTATAGSVSRALRIAVVREPVAEILFNPGSASLRGGDSLQMRAWADGPAGDSLPGRTITWSTHSTSLISVSATGMIHVRGSGTAYVIGTSEAVVDSAPIVTDTRVVARIAVVSTSLKLVPGSKLDNWFYHAYDAQDHELNVLGSWSSSDSTIATVDDNGAVALRAGTATLTVRADTASLRVVVTIAPVSFTAVYAGGTGNGCGLTATHDAYCWGGNDFGQLGTTDSATPEIVGTAPVLGGLHFSSLAVGHTLTCGLTSGGSAYCWGGRDYPNEGSRTPKIVNGVTLATLDNISARACGLDAAGQAYCWGANDYGNLFTPPAGCSAGCRTMPVATGADNQWSAISSGYGSHICGIDKEGVTKCWGINASGQLGDSTLADSALPVTVLGSHLFTQVSAGAATTCALTAEGDAYCWGSDSYGTLGAGIARSSCTPPPFESDPCALTPLAVAGGHRFATVGVAADHACGLTSDGAVWCWGFSESGEGVPTEPSKLAGTLSFTSLSVNDNNCGMASDGRAYCWRQLEQPVAVVGQQ